MSGHFYGVGVGPGDPGLLTLLGVEILRLADVVVAPLSEKAEDSLALTISRPHLKEDVEIREIVFPLVYSREELKSAWQENTEVIRNLLSQGKQVVFITLGDPMVYSTYSYLQQLLQDSGFPITTIPGVPSFCHLASRMGVPLAQGEEPFCVLPATCGEEILELALQKVDNIILMKASRRFAELRQKLEQAGRLQEAVMVSKCGWLEEEIYPDLAEVDPAKIHYLSTILVKRKG